MKFKANRHFKPTVFLCLLLFLAADAVSFAQSPAAAGGEANANVRPTTTVRSADADVKAEIEKALRDQMAVFDRLDAEAVLSYWADDGFVVSDGSVETAAVFKARVRSDCAVMAKRGTKLETRLDHLKVMLLNPEMAVAFYRDITNNTEAGTMTTSYTATADTMVKRNGRWLVLVEHEVTLPNPIEAIVSGLPLGWSRTLGGTADNYSITVDTNVRRSGRASASLKFNCSSDQGPWASLGQAIVADDYRGKRVRLRGWIKTADAGDASIWMRIDGEHKQFGFDNMSGRFVKGTTAWQPYSVVLDVPAEATSIVFGVLLLGKGQAWADDLKLEVVDQSVAITNMDSAEVVTTEDASYQSRPKPKITIRQPVNLGFEDGVIK